LKIFLNFYSRTLSLNCQKCLPIARWVALCFVPTRRGWKGRLDRGEGPVLKLGSRC